MPEPLWLKCFLSLSRHIPATTQHNKKLEHKSSINILPWIIIKANALLHLMQWMWMAWRGMEEGRGVSCFPYFIRKSWKVNRFGSISFYSKSTNIFQSKSGKQWKSHFYFLILNKTNGGTNSIFLISTFFVQLHDCIPATKLIAILHDRIVACDKQKKKRTPRWTLCRWTTFKYENTKKYCTNISPLNAIKGFKVVQNLCKHITAVT